MTNHVTRAAEYSSIRTSRDKLLPGNQEIRKDRLGRIEFTCAEAGGWRRRRRGLYDLILEDLSEPHLEFGACKPWASFDELPRLIEKKLRPAGAAVFNLLPWPGTS